MLNALLQLVLQLTEPMCRMILLLIKAAMAVLYCLLLALPHPAVLNGHEKVRYKKRAREVMSSKGRLQKPKLHRNGTNELQPLQTLLQQKSITAENKGALQQSLLQRLRATLQTLLPPAQAMPHSLLIYRSKAAECIKCGRISRNLKKRAGLSMMQTLSSEA